MTRGVPTTPSLVETPRTVSEWLWLCVAGSGEGGPWAPGRGGVSAGPRCCLWPARPPLAAPRGGGVPAPPFTTCGRRTAVLRAGGRPSAAGDWEEPALTGRLYTAPRLWIQEWARVSDSDNPVTRGFLPDLPGEQSRRGTPRAERLSKEAGLCAGHIGGLPGGEAGRPRPPPAPPTAIPPSGRFRESERSQAQPRCAGTARGVSCGVAVSLTGPAR